MVTKKNFVAGLIALCMLSLILTTVPTWSATEPYDPLVDFNEDGTINMRDIQYEILHFNTFGTPVNRTSLLEAQLQIENLTTLVLELQSRMDSLNATVIEQQNIINNLNSTVVYLNETVIELNGTQGLGPADYDSGWVGIGPGSILYFNHNLNSTNLMIYTVGKGWVNPDYGVWLQSPLYQIYYGGNTYDANNGAGPQYQQGLYWYATGDNQLAVKNFGVECYGGWESVRIRIWKIP